MLTRIRNALAARHDTVDVPGSGVKEEICRILHREGYIRGYKWVEDERQGFLNIQLKYDSDGKPTIRTLRRVSKPSLRIYAKRNQIPQVYSGLGLSILTTSRGLMTSKEARRAKIGGEIICEVW